MVVIMTGCGNKEEKKEEIVNDVSNEEEETKTEISMGEWKDNVYTNDFLGLKFNLPEGWEYANDEEIAEKMNIGKELLNDDQKILAEISELNSVYYVSAMNPNTGDNLTIMTEKPVANVTTEFYLNSLKTQLEAVESIDYEIKETSKETVANREYDVLRAYASISGVSLVQKYYVYKLDNYFLTIIATSVTGEDGMNNMMKAFE